MMPTVLSPPDFDTQSKPGPNSGGGVGFGSGGWDGDDHHWDSGGGFPYASPDTYRLAMWLGVASILMLFAGLSSAYIVREGASGDWRSLAIPPLLLPNSLVLILSSLTLERARRLLKKNGLVRGVKLWMGLTTLLGFVFLVGQLFIWKALAAQGVYLRSDSHSSFFYLMTGAHGVHLAGGVIALIYLSVKAFKEVFATTSLRTAMDVTAIYWHFMDGLWIYLFLLLFYWR